MIPERDGTLIAMEIAEDEDISEGQIVCVDADGKAVGVGDTAVMVMGIAYDVGDDKVTVKRGVFLLANDTTDPVEASSLGNYCFATDSNTVRGHQPVSGFNDIVGKVLGVDSDGVWVEIR